MGISKLKNGKSSGSDLILNEFIKASKNIFLKTLVKLFNKIISIGSIPEEWNNTLISTIHKSGNPNDCNNYRGISVTSCLGKLFNSLLTSRLNNYLESNNLLSPFQAGFRKNHRTTDNIFVLKTLINKYIHKSNKDLFVSFIDFTKAFDTIWRPALLYKLAKKGVGGKFYELIKNMYSNTKCAIKQNNLCSKFFSTNLGVKQGDNLSPTLFNIYVDDFDKCLNKQVTDPVTLGDVSFNNLFFADDLLLFSESAAGLQHCIDSLAEYCSSWKLKVNLKKTNVMILSKRVRDPSSFGFYYKHDRLEITNEYKYLGLIFKSNGLLKYASEHLSARAKKAYFALKSNLPFNHNLSAKTCIKLYESTVLPIITYAAEVWIADFKNCFTTYDKCPFEKIQNFILKDTLGVHGKASNLAVRTELGIYPIYLKIFKLMFNYYTRLSKLDHCDDTENLIILKNAFAEDCKLAKSSSKSWLKSLQDFQHHFGIKDLNISKEQFQEELKTFYKKELGLQMKNISENESGKLSFYSKIITTLDEYEIQPYLSFPISKLLRSNLTKLRVSAHPLYIETGRYCKPPVPREKRLCYSCKNAIENEEHFILHCQEYNDIRSRYSTCFDKKEMCEIINPKNYDMTKNICLYIKESLQLRKQTNV